MIRCPTLLPNQFMEARSFDSHSSSPVEAHGWSTGFKMPDPYGLGEYKEGLLPHDATPEDILEALHLWAVPEEAHPPVGCSSQVNYQLKYHRGSIQVFLLRQCFVTKPKPCWPSNADFQAMSGMPPSYFSFWVSLEFEIGPVDNPIPPGQNVPHKGYNHSSACMAWGEAKILAGVASKAFMVHWSNHFKMQALPGKQSPPFLQHSYGLAGQMLQWKQHQCTSQTQMNKAHIQI